MENNAQDLPLQHPSAAPATPNFVEEIERYAQQTPSLANLDQDIIWDRSYIDHASFIKDQLTKHSKPTGWARTYPEGQEPDDEREHAARNSETWLWNRVIPQYELQNMVALKLDKYIPDMWKDFRRGLRVDAGVHPVWTEHRLPAPPKEMCGEEAYDLADYQLEDIGTAAHIDRMLRGCLMLQDMGQGKTIQSIIVHIVNKLDGCALIVAPAGLVRVWVTELKKNFPHLTFFDYKNIKHTPKTADELLRYDFVLASFHKVANEYREGCEFSGDQELRLQGITGVGRIPAEEKAAAKLADREPVPPERELRTKIPRGLLHGVFWERVIIDEAHRIRNDGTFAASCYALRRRVCTLATGTPQQNDFTDWYALLRMMRREYAVAFKSFFRGNKNKDSEWEPLDEVVSLILGVIIRGMSVRRMKDDNFNGERCLPYIEHHVHPIRQMADNGTKYKHGSRKLGGMTEKVLQKSLEHLWTRWEALPGKEKRKWRRVHFRRPEASLMTGHIFPELCCVRRGAVHPSILLRAPDDPNCKFPTGDMNRKDWLNLMREDENWRSTHIDKFVELVKAHFDNPKNGGLIVFSEYLAVLDLAEIALDEALGLECLRRDGTVSDRHKLENLETFEDQEKQEPPERLILLMTSRSGGEGLNLPMANTVICLCPSFNPYVDLQAWHRVLRRGQLRPCNFFILFMDNSYEHRLAFIHDRKIYNAESILNLSDNDLRKAASMTEAQFKSYMLAAVNASKEDAKAGAQEEDLRNEKGDKLAPIGMDFFDSDDEDEGGDD